MPKPLSRRKLIQKMKKFGFEGPYSGGRHMYMRKGAHDIFIPNDHGSDISCGMIKNILNQAEISFKDWDDKKK